MTDFFNNLIMVKANLASICLLIVAMMVQDRKIRKVERLLEELGNAVLFRYVKLQKEIEELKKEDTNELKR